MVAFNVSFEVVLVKVASAVSANSCLVISLHCVALVNLSPMGNDVDHGDKNLRTNATSANDEVWSQQINFLFEIIDFFHSLAFANIRK